MMKANISILTHIYQINFIFTDPARAYWHIDGLRAGGSAGLGMVSGWA